MKSLWIMAIAACMVFLCGCSWMFANNYRTGSSSSLVAYLYPDGEIPPAVENVLPQVVVPARVGLAFVPGSGMLSLTEVQRADLLNQVRAAFIGKEYVERIEIIPTTYLSGKKGFDSLQQVGRLYNVDLMALVSYDQVITTADRGSSILYWTIVGAYLIKGSSNDVTTFVDTAVFDLNSRRMLFRAPGLDEATRRSTAVGLQETSREIAETSFNAAMLDMTTNLAHELDLFRERIKQDQSVQVVSRNSGGAGSMDLWLLLACVLGLLVVRQKAAL